MHQKLLGALLFSISSTVLANGFYGFNHSGNSYALAGAYQSAALGADAAYYNPANLVFLQNQNAQWEVEGLLAHQEPQSFKGSINLPAPNTPATGEQNAINAFMPYFFYVSPSYGDWRWGFSTSYQGVTASWDNQPQKFLVGEATSATIFLTPVVSLKVSDNFSVGAGLQATYSMLEQSSQGNLFGTDMSLDVSAKGMATSYLLSGTWHVNPALTLSGLYRSANKATLKGDAQAIDGMDNYDGSAEIEVLSPPVLRLAAAYKFDKTTVELVASRIFWSEYDSTQIKLNRQLTGLAALYQVEALRDWQDADTLHLGFTHKYSPSTTLQMGISRDLNLAAAPENMNFDWLDSKITNFGLGIRYQWKKQYELGFAYNYARYDDAKVNNAVVNGEFGRDVHVVSFSVGSSF